MARTARPQCERRALGVVADAPPRTNPERSAVILLALPTPEYALLVLAAFALGCAVFAALYFLLIRTHH